MRIRTVKPEFYQSEQIGKLPRELRLLAVGLLNWSDDEGYFRSHPALIAGAVFPFDSDGQEFVKHGLAGLARIGFVELFNEGIGHVTSFGEHQVINKPSKSRLKAKALTPFTPVALPEDYGSVPVALPHGREGKGMEVEGKGTEEDAGKTSPPPKEVSPPVVSPPTTPPEDWSADDFWRWAQDRRQASGLLAERWPHPRALATWWNAARAKCGVPALKEAFYRYGDDEFWLAKKPPLPWHGFAAQWDRFVPIGGARA